MRTSEPPHDPLAEQSVIGSLLLSNHMIPEVVKVIGARDFYRPNHGTVYTAIIDLFTAGEPVDPVTVSAELERRGELAARAQTLDRGQLGAAQGFGLAFAGCQLREELVHLIGSFVDFDGPEG